VTERPAGEPTLLHEDEETLGEPSFEMWVRDGEPIAGGSYFVQPPLRAVSATWDTAEPDRLVVRADDGTEWFADGVPRAGGVSVRLRPVSGSHRAFSPDA
jgi:hypothetical protein